ncbi:methyltransferase domain-containing protein [Patescibacteria group bacterium]|nr:methyltransferase domain-containing protein [Patescibacteria group bacterium]
MSDISKVNIETYDKTAKEYDEWARGFDMSNEYRQFKEYLVKDSGKILDVGCGSGRDARALFDMGYDVVGIDLSDNMLKLAKLKAPAAKFIRMDFRDLFLENDYFDGFWANATLFLVAETDLKKATQELYRVTKKGGVGFISFKEGEGEVKKEIDGLAKIQLLYSYSELREIMKEVGFKVLMTERKEDQRRKGVFWLRYYLRKV